MRYRSARFPCDYPTQVRMDDIRVPVRVVNISQQGARVSGPVAASAGARVVVDLAGQPRNAQVRWNRQGHIGIRFDLPLAPRDLALVRQAGGQGLGYSAVPGAGWNLHLREMGAGGAG